MVLCLLAAPASQETRTVLWTRTHKLNQPGEFGLFEGGNKHLFVRTGRLSAALRLPEPSVAAGCAWSDSTVGYSRFYRRCGPSKTDSQSLGRSRWTSTWSPALPLMPSPASVHQTSWRLLKERRTITATLRRHVGLDEKTEVSREHVITLEDGKLKPWT